VSGYIRAQLDIPPRETTWFLEACEALWDAGVTHGVDPVVLIAQCALETGWGQFGGVIDSSYNNTCGLKAAGRTGDTPEDHARFDSLATGALAHCQHLMGYAGVVPGTPIVDPRWSGVAPGTVRHGIAPAVRELGGLVDPNQPELGSRWNPDPEYGVKIEAIFWRLRGQT
jgi:N-acetylmuramoyl-L-alanine amidase